MPYLFQCAIGPVQDFIATARKSRDLWYGSWMLSELAKAAAKAIADA
ncbi:MAG: type III-B CRISPR-associated protein Cas10/Cmr2, partial [Anaerolineae bacterium]